MGRTLGRQNPYFVLVNVIVIVIVLVIVIVMRMSIGTNPRVAEPVLGAALGISSTFRTWTPASVVNVCWVRPSEKFWLGVDPRSSGFKKGPRKRSLSPEWRCWAGSPSCACPKTACVGALGQQESDALQEITVEKIKWSQIHGIRV